MKKTKIILTTILILILTLFFIRLFSERQLDDLTIGIECEEELIKKSDVLYVIPSFNETNISEEKGWCSRILNFNKELAMHGVYHTYKEFGEKRNELYVSKGKEIFTECFGYEPTKFKPPNLGWTNENNWMKKDFEIDLRFNQIFHKTYHCNDTGVFRNRLIDFF
tara:strand:- start:79 stop:573 length:495 start_codon:yes stop_codon:yes gene_type:complete